MMNQAKVLRSESTQAARDIWLAVDTAAAKAPEWVRTKIQQAPINTEPSDSPRRLLSLKKD